MIADVMLGDIYAECRANLKKKTFYLQPSRRSQCVSPVLSFTEANKLGPIGMSSGTVE